MKIWLVKAGEPLPIDDDNPRLLRTGMMYETFSREHDVKWITECFHHQRKVFRFDENTTVDTSTRSSIVLLKTKGYRSNISASRLRDDVDFSRKVRDQFATADLPDVVICSYPLIFTAYEVVKQCQQLKIPVVIDVRDLWPDVFSVASKGGMKAVTKLVEWALWPFVRYIFKNCTGIIGITDSIVDWACAKGGRQRTQYDQTYPLSVIRKPHEGVPLTNAMKFWREKGIEDEDKIVSYVGLLNGKVDLETVLDGFIKANFPPQVKLVLGGEGDDFARLKSRYGHYPSIIFAGWLDKYQISTLLDRSCAGLAPYKTRLDFSISIPNKVIEYMAYSVPVVAAIKGEITKLIRDHGCGFCYREKDPESLAKALHEAVFNAVKNESCSQSARKLFDERFDGDKMFAEVVTYLEEMFALPEESRVIA